MSVVVLCSSMLACSASGLAPRDAGGESDAGAGRDAGTTDAGFDSGPNPVSSLDDERRCWDVQRRINDLMSSHQVCAKDEDCVVGQLDVPCFERLACTQAWSKSTDVEELKRTALSLRDKYEQSCHRCESAGCSLRPADVRAFCDSESKLCTYYSGRESDADAGPSKSDAGTAPTLPSSPYACQANDDCVIKDVGECCTYPRCANVDAEFERASCPGMGCVAGYKSYDHCECRENVCRTMFREVIVY